MHAEVRSDRTRIVKRGFMRKKPRTPAPSEAPPPSDISSGPLDFISQEWVVETISGLLNVGVAVVSKEYKVLWSNRVLKDLFGEPGTMPCHLFYNQATSPCPGCGVKEIFERGGGNVVHKQTGLDAQGDPVYSEIIATPIRDKNGEISAVLELVIPITEKVLAQERNKRLHERLERAQKMDAVATLAGGIAHKFNNLLTILLGHLELMGFRSPPDEMQAHSMDQMRDACLQMRDLTAQLLAYARGGKYQVEKRCLGEFLEEVLPKLRYHVAPTVRLDLQVEPGGWKVEGDFSQLQMVLSALLANAGEAVSDHGNILVRCRNENFGPAEASAAGNLPPGPYVHVSVQDDGEGMDETTRRRAFEPFFSTRFQGRGLGLAAAYGIVRNHKGAISLESSPGEGTTVHVYLPAVDAPVGAGKVPQANGAVVLFIEDEPLVRQIAESILEELGYEAVFADGAAQALEILAQSRTRFDWIFMDVILPDMHGRELFRRIRALLPESRIIVCSGFSSREEVRELLDAGALAYLPKPFTPTDLQKAVSEAMKKLSP